MIYRFDLSGLDFQLFRDFIHGAFGILLGEDKRAFVKMKLYPRITALGLNSFREYYEVVARNGSDSSEPMKMISLLTNNETYLFRETPQLSIFSELILPELQEEKKDSRKVRVLSAGCSTGEEAYTLAMLAFEFGGFFWEWDLEIIGLDIDRAALKAAREGIFYPRSFQVTDPFFTAKFFARDPGGFYRAKKNVRKMLSFRHGNLVNDESWRDLEDVDVIFCRNVLIYFSEEKTNAALENFRRALKPGGYLLLGHSETISDVSCGFERVRCRESTVYRKRG